MEVEYELQEYSIYVTSPDFWVATTQSEWITIVTDSGVEGNCLTQLLMKKGGGRHD